MWQSQKNWFAASERPKTGPLESTTHAETLCTEQAPDVPNTNNKMQDARFWDAWWNDHISKGDAGRFLFPMIEAPLVKHRGIYFDVANSDTLLIAVMAEYGLRSVLCAGSGLSQEPRALAEAGFDVTALDLSRTASDFARSFEFNPNDMFHFHGPAAERTWGRLDFVVGSLLDMAACPGPFDVIIERRTVQQFAERDRSTALQALAGRLGKVGIFLSHCNDGSYSPSRKIGPFHASESWFREQYWTIWDGAPCPPLSGRVAWLVRSAG
jgi:hypothetical protein